MTTSALAVADQVLALLKTLTNVNVYDGEVADDEGNRVAPPSDLDGRVHAYAVLYASPGRELALILDGTGDTLDATFQVTCVGGDRTRALGCVEAVRSVLTGAWILDGTAMLTEVVDPGALRRDDDVSPPRFWAPLLFTVSA